MPWPALIALTFCTIPLTIIDIRDHRLPNQWNALLAIGGFLGHASRAVQSQTLEPLRNALLAGIAGLLLMLVLHLVSRGALGMGDVKLVGALGVVVANVTAVGIIVFVAFACAALWAAANLLIRRYHRQSRLAFGPFILFGAWLVVALP
jgi:leader peptidase (prepilin peptidase)/N-methyltransferase